jgi:hypothetical protein
MKKVKAGPAALLELRSTGRVRAPVPTWPEVKRQLSRLYPFSSITFLYVVSAISGKYWR